MNWRIIVELRDLPFDTFKTLAREEGVTVSDLRLWQLWSNRPLDAPIH